MQNLSLHLRRNSSHSSVYSCNSLDECTQVLHSLCTSHSGILFCVVDANVLSLWHEQLLSFFAPVHNRIVLHEFQASEHSKSLTSVGEIIAAMQEAGCDRSSLVIGIGGGVTTDVAGLVASLFLRGVTYAALPTSLLAMVDASVGGKNGVNAMSQKNAIGTIEQPHTVVCCTAFLSTLPPVEMFNGFAEVLKMAFITRDQQLLDCLEEIRTEPLSCTDAQILRVVHRCCELKATFVEADEQDKGVRAVLNFGHTVGHALEAHSGYEIKHGYAVAQGMRQALQWSVELSKCQNDLQTTYSQLLHDFGLNIGAYARFDPDGIRSGMHSDKKRLRGKDRLVVLNSEGKGEVREVNYSKLPMQETPHLLCVSVGIEHRRDMTALSQFADHVVELCIQPNAKLSEICDHLPTQPCVLTIRNATNSWRADEVEDARLKAWEAGLYVDIDALELQEWNVHVTHAQKLNLIVSRHGVTTLAQAREFLILCAQDYPQAIVKIVFDESVPSPQETCEATRKHARELGLYRSIVHVMGKDQSTRVVGAAYGNYWTYVAPTASTAVAKGQLTLEDANSQYGFPTRRHAPKLFGLIGNPVASSPGYKLHNALFRRVGIHALYVPILVESIDNFLSGDAHMFAGLSVTMPWKQAAADVVGSAHPINTLVKRNGDWQGFNTDRTALEQLLPTEGTSAIVYGTGSTARNVVQALKKLEYTHITVKGRDQQKVSELLDFLGLHQCEQSVADLLVNASALGMCEEDASPFSDAEICAAGNVFDCVHNPRTALRNLCEQHGVSWQGGQEMFVEQALLQFALFTERAIEGIDRQELIDICFHD